MESERLIEGEPTRAGEAKHETVTLDGVNYDFVLIDRGGEFVGSWRLPTCNRGDASPLRYRDPGTIRLWARHSLEVHHLLFHDKSRK